MSIGDVHLEPPDSPGPRDSLRGRKGQDANGLTVIVMVLLVTIGAASGAFLGGYFFTRTTSEERGELYTELGRVVSQERLFLKREIREAGETNRAKLMQEIAEDYGNRHAALVESIQEQSTEEQEALVEWVGRTGEENRESLLQAIKDFSLENNTLFRELFDQGVTRFESRLTDLEQTLSNEKREEIAAGLIVTMADIAATVTPLLEILDRFETERALNRQAEIETYAQLVSFVEVYDVNDFMMFVESSVFTPEVELVHSLVPVLDQEVAVKLLLFHKKMEYLKQGLARKHQSESGVRGTEASRPPARGGQDDSVAVVEAAYAALVARNKSVAAIIRQVHGALSLGIDTLINMNNYLAGEKPEQAGLIDGSAVAGMEHRFKKFQNLTDEDFRFYPGSVVRKAESVKTVFLETTLTGPGE